MKGYSHLMLTLSNGKTVSVLVEASVTGPLVVKAIAYWSEFRQLFSLPRTNAKDTLRMHVMAKDDPSLSVDEFNQICRVGEAIEVAVCQMDMSALPN